MILKENTAAHAVAFDGSFSFCGRTFRAFQFTAPAFILSPESVSIRKQGGAGEGIAFLRNYNENACLIDGRFFLKITAASRVALRCGTQFVRYFALIVFENIAGRGR